MHDKYIGPLLQASQGQGGIASVSWVPLQLGACPQTVASRVGSACSLASGDSGLSPGSASDSPVTLDRSHTLVTVSPHL